MAKKDITVIKLSKNQQLSTLLFADEQMIIADREYFNGLGNSQNTAIVL
jgi:hypothetical protein